MHSEKLVLELLQKIKSGEYVGCTTVDLANDLDYGVFAVIDAFTEIEKRGFVDFRYVGAGDAEILGITERGKRFLNK
ncbi:hypothetical protein J22TS1_43650 [Siminovitchia terrae]|uniref:hypothetical protein n=1 Tax=Siminovitchia terrae TaxID=1914933 RepID=UPI001B273C5A|nr:hypothetical protein [Siminovitchia terrae]GIN93314.1 hypothetical protein J22TS1_43650 [Siminovitchia terrae]